MIVDIIILIIVAISILIGMKKGFIVCAVNFFSLMIALIIAFTFCKPFATYLINNTTIDEKVEQNIKSSIPMNNQDVNITVNSNLPTGIKNYINDAETNVNDAKNTAIDTTTQNITAEVMIVIAFVIIFIAVKIVLMIVKVISKIINKLPVLKQIDKVGGIIIGALEGIVIVYITFALISVVSPAIKEQKILDYINESNIGKQMYNNNLLVNKIYGK